MCSYGEVIQGVLTASGHRNYNSKLETNGIPEKAEGTTLKELTMNHLSSFSDPLILPLCSFHTILNWITASFFTISSYSWPSLCQVWKHYHCLGFKDAAEYCITSQSVQKYFDGILLLDIGEQLSKWRVVFHFVITMSPNAACLFMQYGSSHFITFLSLCF